MAKHGDINEISIDNLDDEWVANSIEEAMPLPPPSFTRIPKVPKIILVSDNYNKYYVPKVVSIGPYHHNNEKLGVVEKLKPVFTKKLLSKYNVGLRTLSKKLGEANMVQELRSFYEEKSTDNFTDEEFTRMMLLDGCFILYYILFIFKEKPGSCRELRSHQIVFIQQDLFLLENQIPFKVVNEVMSLIKLDRRDKIASFFTDNFLMRGREKSGSNEDDQYSGQESLRYVADHLLHRLHSSITRTSDFDGATENEELSNLYTFRNVNELADIGIYFKPSRVMSLAHVEFVPQLRGFIADVKLPPITVDNTTKPMLLNLVAYEMCVDDEYRWVTSFICFLVSLIDRPQDVKALRKAKVLINSLGSDQEVATLFNEIGTDLMPNNLAYAKEKNQIQRYNDTLTNRWFHQYKNEYIKEYWSIMAVLAAVIALFLTAVQTYFTIWDRKGECEDLCSILKTNHHL